LEIEIVCCIGIFDVNTAGDLDYAIHILLIWKLGYFHMVTEFNWTPLRNYESWAEELKQLAKGE
jgi:hypothetical protein